jgi:hypothetical protein
MRSALGIPFCWVAVHVASQGNDAVFDIDTNLFSLYRGHSFELGHHDLLKLLSFHVAVSPELWEINFAPKGFIRLCGSQNGPKSFGFASCWPSSRSTRGVSQGLLSLFF